MMAFPMLAMGYTANTPAPLPTSTSPPAHEGMLPDLSVDDWINISLVVGGPVVLIGLFLANIIRPGSLKSGMRGVTSHPSWVWLMAALVTIVFAYAARSGIGELMRHYSISLDDERGKAISTLAFVVPGAMVGLFLAYLLDLKGDAGLSAQPVDFPIGLGCLLLAIPVVFGAQIAASWIHLQISHEKTGPISHAALKSLAGDSDNPWVWVTIGSAVLLSPLFEEFLYRGFLQSALLKFGGSPGIAIVCTSAVFTSMHWGPGAINTWYGLVPIFMLSLGLGVAFEKTKRIGVPVVMHMLFNAANVALVMLAK